MNTARLLVPIFTLQDFLYLLLDFLLAGFSFAPFLIAAWSMVHTSAKQRNAKKQCKRRVASLLFHLFFRLSFRCYRCTSKLSFIFLVCIYNPTPFFFSFSFFLFPCIDAHKRSLPKVWCAYIPALYFAFFSFLFSPCIDTHKSHLSAVLFAFLTVLSFSFFFCLFFACYRCTHKPSSLFVVCIYRRTPLFFFFPFRALFGSPLSLGHGGHGLKGKNKRKRGEHKCLSGQRQR